MKKTVGYQVTEKWKFGKVVKPSVIAVTNLAPPGNAYQLKSTIN